jgi:hypothetical protein
VYCTWKPSACWKRRFASPVQHGCNAWTQICITGPQYVKKLTNNQHSHTNIQELEIDRKHLREQWDTADAFSKYFSSITKNISKNNTNNETNNKEVPAFQYYLKQNNVDNQSAKNKDSYEFYEISTNLLKISAIYIYSPLTYICNKAILSGIFSWPNEVLNH